MSPAPVPTAETVAERLDDVRRRIAATGVDPDGVTVVAVTKGFDATVVDAAVGAGLRDLGENYAQELRAKWRPGCRWHLLGPPQGNKIAALAPIVDVWEAVGDLRTGERIAARRPAATVFAQVDFTGLPQRAGCAPDAAVELVDGLRSLGLDVAGLMAVAPATSAAAARRAFAELRDLAVRAGVAQLSMGMSGDFEIAVQEGATTIRLGTALFGRRLPHASDGAGPRTGPGDLRR